jgi:hypothetical protein
MLIGVSWIVELYFSAVIVISDRPAASVPTSATWEAAARQAVDSKPAHSSELHACSRRVGAPRRLKAVALDATDTAGGG